MDSDHRAAGFTHHSLLLEKASIDAAMTTAFSPATANDGWGTIDQATAREIIDLYTGVKAFTGITTEIDEVVTFDSLDRTAANRSELE